MSTTKIRLDTRLHYVIDAKSSDFTVRAFPSGILAALGHSPIIAIRGFDGEAHFVTGSLENAALKVQVDPATFDVRGDVSEKDRREMEREMRQKVLEIDQFPQISFKGTQITARKQEYKRLEPEKDESEALAGGSRSRAINRDSPN